MISNYVQLKGRNGLALVLAALMLALVTVPALANVAPDEMAARPEAGQNGTIGPCVSNEVSGILGQEGGLLSLLGVDGHSEPVATIVKGEAYSLQTVHTGPSATFVVYTRVDCLGREGGLLFW